MENGTESPTTVRVRGTTIMKIPVLVRKVYSVKLQGTKNLVALD